VKIEEERRIFYACRQQGKEVSIPCHTAILKKENSLNF
jgi:hypothetical protein